MRTKLIVALVVVALAATGVATAVSAQRGPGAGKPGGPGPGAGGMGCPMGFLGPRVAQELGLTQEQIRQLQQLRQDFWSATQTVREQLQAKCKQMIELWTSAQPNAGRIKALAADIDALRAEIRDTGIDYMIRGLGVLTPAQREKLRAKVKEMGQQCLRMGGGCCFGPGMGCGLGLGLGMGPGPCAGTGAGLGPRNATGPRARMGTCPKLAK